MQPDERARTYTNCILCGHDVPPWTDAGDDHVEGWLASSPAVCDECKDARAAAIDFFAEIPGGTLCRKCREHPGTVKWTGNASAGDVNHGALVFAWCNCCVTKAAIDYAEEQAARLPGLRAQLERSCEEIGSLAGEAP